MRNKFLMIIIGALFLSGCSSKKASDQEPSNFFLPDLGEAPEISKEIWINTPNPLHLADLQGKVVIIEMWTFGCINCRNVIPSLISWHEKYSPEGLVIIGNHYPEFDYEADFDNLKKAVEELNIPYAVTEDNLGITWKAYDTHFWPTLYLIDKNGHLRYVHVGEGRYKETELAIRTLLEAPDN